MWGRVRMWKKGLLLICWSLTKQIQFRDARNLTRWCQNYQSLVLNQFLKEGFPSSATFWFSASANNYSRGHGDTCLWRCSSHRPEKQCAFTHFICLKTPAVERGNIFATRTSVVLGVKKKKTAHFAPGWCSDNRSGKQGADPLESHHSPCLFRSDALSALRRGHWQSFACLKSDLPTWDESILT